MTTFRLSWHSRVMARTTAGKTLYATRAQAQADADFCNERYADIGMSYSVEAVDDAAPAAGTDNEPDHGQSQVAAASAIGTA